MCEKNFEGKQMSFFPNDDMMLSDENIGDCINDDDDAVVVKTSKRKKRSKYEYCDTCDQNITLEKKRDRAVEYIKMLQKSNGQENISGQQYTRVADLPADF